ncbi:MAG: AAA family ATPase [Nitrospirae bacterium]|nr:AAA family ATPase [Nitrospirota bacterium]
MSQKHVLFEDALGIAIEKTRNRGNIFGKKVVLVRDFRGCIRVLMQKKKLLAKQKTELNKYRKELSEALGAYGFPPDSMVLDADDLEQGDQLFDSSDLHLITYDKKTDFTIKLLERQIIGQDWIREPLERHTTTRRVTFFGIKGGVGRSTALANWSWRLAKQGKKVLIFDLDLESPGVSSTLLPENLLPDYGIVDWFVEDGVGQADIVNNAMTASSPLDKDLPGEIRVVPAFGRDAKDYLPKLSRCYADSNGNTFKPWAKRLQQMVEQVEDYEKPDLVILDSRAGLHDIAAASVTRMDAETFLFAVDSAQTWKAYSFLFEQWKQLRQIREFRHRLQIVASLIPETGRPEYLTRFITNSWDLFQTYLYDKDDYDETGATTDDVFNFGQNDDEAPHYPLPVYWQRALQEFNPVSGIDEKVVKEAMGKFMEEAEKIVFEDGNI